MGLQATAATKRKHEISFEGKNTNTYSPPPLKSSKWSLNNNNYIEAMEEQVGGVNKIITRSSAKAAEEHAKNLANLKNNNNNNNNNDEVKSCQNKINTTTPSKSSSITSSTTSTPTATATTTTTATSASNSSNKTTTTTTKPSSIISKDNPKEVSNSSSSTITTTTPTESNSTQSLVNSTNSAANGVTSLVASLIPSGSELSPTTPLPPTSSGSVPEDSIAKLEVVAAVPCEPWSSSHSSEPVDCISKLQAVAVPSDPWGSISTRSTLATTLLSADELDDDDDDFEDDYEEEESIIPTYCPLRYHPFSNSVQNQRINNYSATSSALSYGNSRPSYYSEPFPQQNCSRTGSPHHMRMGSGFNQWQNASSSNGNSQFYASAENAYVPPQQQQTIRCAENGKSYLELGCSSPVNNNNNNSSNGNQVPAAVSVPFGSLHAHGSQMEARHAALKRCCDGRNGTWCGINKNCYKDIRLKIRNLSMFKLSRFRQVSEQSLHRSVLICNTLKRIDREIEAEAKEMQMAHAAHAAQHHQAQQAAAVAAQYNHQHHHMPQQQSSVQQHQQHLLGQHSQQGMHQQHQDYAPPGMNCARLSNNMDYQQQQHHQASTHFQQQQHHSVPSQPTMPANYHHSGERLEPNPTNYQQVNPSNNVLSKPSNGFVLNDSSSQNNSHLHNYDPYPFREGQSGRATPFPCQSVISTPSSSETSNASLPPATPNTTSSSSAVAASASNSTNVDTSTSMTTNGNDVASSYVEEDSTRTINWSSVLSLSSQSALDPLNNNDLFSMLPAVTSVTNPATAVPVLPPSPSSNSTSSDSNTETVAVSITGSFTTVQTSSNNQQTSDSTSSAATQPPSCSNTTATFTTLSTISSATHSLTSSYVSSMSSNSSSSSSSWEYGFLDMEFGLGSEFTELVPSCKLSSATDELYKSSLQTVSAAARYTSVENELEQPAHIMVGS